MVGDPTKLKVYVVLPDDIPPGIAINSAAHAGVMLHWYYKHNEVYNLWFYNSFKKVSVQVTRAVFNQVKKSFPSIDYLTVTEDTLGNIDTCLIFKPMLGKEIGMLRDLKLWGSN